VKRRLVEGAAAELLALLRDASLVDPSLAASSLDTGCSEPLSRYIWKMARTRAASLALTTSFGLGPVRSTS